MRADTPVFAGIDEYGHGSLLRQLIEFEIRQACSHHKCDCPNPNRVEVDGAAADSVQAWGFEEGGAGDENERTEH